MAQASYWECPAGTGKKIKFCCPDLVDEWEKIIRLIEGDQHRACLELIEQLEQSRPDRACLLAMKIEILLRLKKFPEAEQTVEQFLQKHPDNPTALLEKAYATAAHQSGQEAYQWLLRGLAQCQNVYPLCTPRVIYLVASRLMGEGHFVASRPLLQFGMTLSGAWQEDFREEVEFLDANPSIPLVLRESFTWRLSLLENTPVEEPLRQVRQKVNKGHWLEAAEQLQQLTETYPELPGLWWHLAVQRAWILDVSGAIEALRRYAALRVPNQEAILAEAAALALSADPLGDMIVSYKITYTPEDESDLQAALSLSKQVVPYSGEVPFFSRPEDGDIPPRCWYLLLDRPVPGRDEPCTEQSLPSVISYAALFGRQTDRQARLEVYGVHEGNRSQVEGLLNQFVGQGLRPDPLVESLGELSATKVSFGLGTFSSSATGPKPDPQREKDIRQDRFAQRWLDQPLGIFQGRSPRQAAQDPQCNASLEAVLLWVEYLASRIRHPLDRQYLRRQLGLPASEPVDLQKTPLRQIPLYRWAEIDLSKASDEDISEGYIYASYFRWKPAVNHFAEAFLGRPGLAKNPVWLSACYSAAVSAIPSDQAGGLIEQGRQRALEMKLSCAPWDLLEITYHLEREESQKLDGLLRHIIQQHQYEPGVLESLIEILEPFGLLSSQQADQAGPGGPAGETDSGLWTPGGEEKPSSPKKLWTPDAP